MNYRTDQLQRLQSEIQDLAKECLVGVVLVDADWDERSLEAQQSYKLDGIRRLLKFYPIGTMGKVFLKLAQPAFSDYVVIYSHRNSELTSLHKGKRVSTSWVAGFLKHNASFVKQLIIREKSLGLDAQALEQNLAKQNLAKQKPKKRSVRRVKCDACNGEGRLTLGDPIEGAPFEYCSTCRGGGYLDSNEQSSPNGPSS